MVRFLIFTATYNEAENVEELIRGIQQYLPGQDILFVDDSSPDGTGAILDELATANPEIRVIHRPTKLGIGSAHRLAMEHALINDYDFLITMDADFSHHPKYLPRVAEALEDNDFVTGSRYARGGECQYGLFRRVLSRTANTCARLFLNIPLRECTTSYRGFRVSLLRALNTNNLVSEGYSFFLESIYYTSLLTKRMAEFPICFEDRRAGQSKISYVEILKGVYKLLLLLTKRLRRRALPQRLTKPWTISPSACINCGSIYKTELYEPTDGHRTTETAAYRCTSTGHNSHGSIVQCLRCGLVYSDTDLTDERITQIYSAVEDQTYAENLDARYRTFRHNLSQLAGILPPAGTLLDVGAHCGGFLKVAEELGYDAMGVEPSAWAARYAREVLEQKVVEGTVKNLPPHMTDFDIVTMWDVLEHMKAPVEELLRIHSRLRPGGFLILSTLDIANWLPRIMGRRWPWLMDMHLYYFTEEIMKQILTRAGFRCVLARPYRHVITLDYFLLKLVALGLPGARIFRTMSTNLRLSKFHVSFKFGDIKLYVAQKVLA